MGDEQVAIGQIKRDISKLVNRVAFGRERIILTSRGKPRAVLVSLEDYEKLQQEEQAERMAKWQEWEEQVTALSARILERRGGEPIDVDALWAAEKADQEMRDDAILGF